MAVAIRRNIGMRILGVYLIPEGVTGIASLPLGGPVLAVCLCSQAFSS